MLISKALGLSDEQIRAGLKQVTLTDMRMQLVPIENGPLFINDAYNAAPTSMNAAIQFVQDTAMRPEKWLVFGDMLELGDNEKAIPRSRLRQKLMNKKLSMFVYLDHE